SQVYYDLLDAAEVRRPDVVLLLDYPGFNLRLAKEIKAMNIPGVYYISPQLWAWRQGRVKTVQKYIDKMLVIFPFEIEFYNQHGVQAEFVGHPLLDELDPQHFDPVSRARHRARYGLGPDDVVLGLMPGSRHSEIKHHLHTQLQAARELFVKNPSLKIALFVAPSFRKEQAQGWLSDLDFPLMLIKDEPFSMIDLADVVLCASGTATLMVGLLEKPMVIMYKMNRLSSFFAKRFVKNTRHFGLINLVLDDRVVPELFQEQADVPHLVRELEPLISDRGLRDKFTLSLRPAKDRLGSKGATERVAQALESYWRGTP
ncbi:MAG: lipid-A-disaccharide synthase, partial [Bdellovibrionales bacterium]